jgi:hypothetical protein
MAFAVASSTRLTTNSPLRRMFLSECLVAPSLARGLMPTTQTGGSSLNTLKNENGAQLAIPFSLRVEIQAIGRGITSPISSL